MKNKRILITGGGGYIGCVLARYLMEKDLSVTIFDKFYFGEDKVDFLRGDMFRVVKGDIRNLPEGLFDDIFAVIHLAAFSNDPTADASPEVNKKINTDATVELAQKAKDAGVNRFIFASTASIYDMGMGGDVPFDKARVISTEKTKVDPTHYYSKSKYDAEKGLKKLADDKFCVVMMRKGTVHGYSPRMRLDVVVNVMLKNALKDKIIKVFCRGVQIRPVIDIRDVSRAYFRALIVPSEKINGEVFNIGYKNVQVSELAFQIQRVLEKQFGIFTKIIFEQDDREDRSYEMSLEKAKKLLGFTARIPIEDSIMSLMYWFGKNKIKDFDNPIYYNIKWMTPIFEKEK